MNLLGLPITIYFGKNGKYVKKEECHRAQAEVKQFIDAKVDTLEKSLTTNLLNIERNINTRIESIVLAISTKK